MTSVHQGSCLCGAVRFSVSGPLGSVIYCHCSQCRKQTGHIFAGTNVLTEDLVVSGAENLVWFAASASARRGFCGICGSTLFWKAANYPYTSVLAGAFDGETGMQAVRHDFVASKGDYYQITDGLPQNDSFPQR